MNIARILYPVEVLGPGKRFGIWFAGCPHHCLGCSNPELWNTQEKYETTLEQVMFLIRTIAKSHTVDGFTITGGDPFAQATALNKLILAIREISDDILVYTGYTMHQLKCLNNVDIQELLQNISVLIDDRYIQDQNNGTLLRGSDNQSIYVMNLKYQDLYNEYLTKAVNQIQNFTTNSGIISVGIHKQGFEQALKEEIIKKGIEI